MKSHCHDSDSANAGNRKERTLPKSQTGEPYFRWIGEAAIKDVSQRKSRKNWGSSLLPRTEEWAHHWSVRRLKVKNVVSEKNTTYPGQEGLPQVTRL